MEESIGIILGLSLVVNVLFLLIIFWQRKRIILSVLKLFNRNFGKEVRVYHKDRTYTDYVMPDVISFDWKKKWFGRFFSSLPEFLFKNTIPPTPYARSRESGFGYYEFHEDSNQALDPYERMPDLYMKEADENDLMNAFEAGALWNSLKHKSKFNMILMLLMLANIALGVILIFHLNGLTEDFTKFVESVTPVLEGVKTYISEQGSNVLGDGVAGRVA